MNENGAMLLSFCALNCLSIMNTFFEKRDVHSIPGNILAVKYGTVLILL